MSDYIHILLITIFDVFSDSTAAATAIDELTTSALLYYHQIHVMILYHHLIVMELLQLVIIKIHQNYVHLVQLQQVIRGLGVMYFVLYIVGKQRCGCWLRCWCGVGTGVIQRCHTMIYVWSIIPMYQFSDIDMTITTNHTYNSIKYFINIISLNTITSYSNSIFKFNIQLQFANQSTMSHSI